MGLSLPPTGFVEPDLWAGWAQPAVNQWFVWTGDRHLAVAELGPSNINRHRSDWQHDQRFQPHHRRHHVLFSLRSQRKLGQWVEPHNWQNNLLSIPWPMIDPLVAGSRGSVLKIRSAAAPGNVYGPNVDDPAPGTAEPGGQPSGTSTSGLPTCIWWRWQAIFLLDPSTLQGFLLGLNLM
jgi:hypothetical protein